MKAMHTIPAEYSQEHYLSLLQQSAVANPSTRLMIGVPMTGLIRAEWAIARWGQIIPCNWSLSEYVQLVNQVTPLGYGVADARNIMVHHAVQGDFEWYFSLDHDVILPPDAFVQLNTYMREAKVPVVSGLYFAKCHPPEPLIYRGRGNSYFAKWALGEKVWVDGIPMGCCLIHGSLLKAMYVEAPEYVVPAALGQMVIRRVFDTPAFRLIDPETGTMRGFSGTEDLAWCDRVIHGEFLKKAGWKAIARRRWPFLIDTSILCQHIDPSGQKFPLELRW